MAMHEGPNGPPAPLPETRYAQPPKQRGDSKRARTILGVGAAATLAGLGALARLRLGLGTTVPSRR
jgi:hypothetical protein